MYFFSANDIQCFLAVISGENSVSLCRKIKFERVDDIFFIIADKNVIYDDTPLFYCIFMPLSKRAGTEVAFLWCIIGFHSGFFLKKAAIEIGI